MTLTPRGRTAVAWTAVLALPAVTWAACWLATATAVAR